LVTKSGLGRRKRGKRNPNTRAVEALTEKRTPLGGQRGQRPGGGEYLKKIENHVKPNAAQCGASFLKRALERGFTMGVKGNNGARRIKTRKKREVVGDKKKRKVRWGRGVKWGARRE